MSQNNEAAEICQRIHSVVSKLPNLKDPSEIPYYNGLYFFYEEGEQSPHGFGGRIVRVGNHPRSQDRLQGRLWDHYSPNKNFSVFRKSLGGALLRQKNPNHDCLKPGPGKGHWEKQDSRVCLECKALEDRVTYLLRQNFWFRCVEIKDQKLRNILEKKLIGSISICPVCKPSDRWLGLYAYNEKVRSSGLWNSNYVYGQYIMSLQDLKTLERLVAYTLQTFNKVQ